MYVWGNNSRAQLGDGGTISSATPTQLSIPASSGKFIDVSMGTNAACAIDTKREAYCWGRSIGGILGNGESTGNISTPVKVSFPAGSQVRKIKVDNRGACALVGDRSYYCWGWNRNGQFGLGAAAVGLYYLTPTFIIR